MDLMLSQVVCGRAPGRVRRYRTYHVNRADLRIDVNKQNKIAFGYTHHSKC